MGFPDRDYRSRAASNESCKNVVKVDTHIILNYTGNDELQSIAKCFGNRKEVEKIVKHQGLQKSISSSWI